MTTDPRAIAQRIVLPEAFAAATRSVIAALTSAAVFASTVLAQTVPDSTATIREVLKNRFPEIEIRRVQASPLPGIVEVFTPSEIVYADLSGKFVFVGKLLDTETRADLTAASWSESLRVDFNRLPFDKAIKIVKGNGSRALAVFEDPECPYCRRLERALENVDNLTLYVFLLPLTELHPTADKTARDIWCSQDRTTAWSDWMNRKIAPQSAGRCETHPLAELRALAEHLQINATPTLFFADGYRLSAALTAEQIEQSLAEHAPSPKSTAVEAP